MTVAANLDIVAVSLQYRSTMRVLTVFSALLILHMATSSKLVCHMTNWAQYRPGMGKFTADNIDPFLCTHVVYALATINSFNQVTTIEWNDEDHYRQLNVWKSMNPELKTLLTVGGLVNGMSPYITVVASPQNRAAFIRSVISFLRAYDFDGLNVNWDYPAHNGSPMTDKQSFTVLLSELANAFTEEARSEKKTPLLLSAEVAAIRTTAHAAYEANKIAAYLDFINVKTYDYHGSWEPFTGHNSPLYRSSVDSGASFHHNINSSISYWLDSGAPAEKLLLGFPTYGRTFRLGSASNGLGAHAIGAADAGVYTRTAGFWSYYEVCDFLRTPGVYKDIITQQEVPYATYSSSWVGYDDEKSFSSKVQFLTTHNLGGAHVWTMDMDDFGGAFCGKGPYPLINHLRMSMGFPPKSTTTQAPTTTRGPTTTPDPITQFCKHRPDGLYVNEADRTTYFQCFAGNTFLHRCQPGLIYYDSCKCCNWP